MPAFLVKYLIAAVAAVLIAGGVLVMIPREEKRIDVPLNPPKAKSHFDQLIGSSVEGREIRSYSYGRGPREIVFVGGIHGGYEWNGVALAYKFIDYLDEHHHELPSSLKITVIPNANPDAVFKGIGKEGKITEADAKEGDLSEARFNAHGVDINRNFACKWKNTAMWRGREVSPGSEPFSEPESRAIRDYALAHRPYAFVFWHSQANAVYASECDDGILPETLTIMDAYATAAQYPSVKSFDAYPVTGDAEGWLALIGIPAITVEMKSHDAVEWDRNLAGFNALVIHASK